MKPSEEITKRAKDIKKEMEPLLGDLSSILKPTLLLGAGMSAILEYLDKQEERVKYLESENVELWKTLTQDKIKK